MAEQCGYPQRWVFFFCSGQRYTNVMHGYSSSLLMFLFLPLAGGAVSGWQNTPQPDYVRQAQHPFDNDGDNLPDLGMTPETRSGEKHLAEMMKAFGEASMTDNGLDTGAQARQFAVGQLRDVVNDEVNHQVGS